jgi:hypothetical protein
MPRAIGGGPVHWWPAIGGGFLLLLSAAFLAGLRRSWDVTVTDPWGNVTADHRPLRPLERIAVVVISLSTGAFGVLLLAGAVPWSAERVPTERLLPALVAVLVAAGFAAGAVTAWVYGWRARGGPPRAGTGARLDPEDGPEDALLGLVGQGLLSHPAGAALLGAGCAAAAAVAASQVIPVWQGDDGRMAALMHWLQPVSALGGLLGVGEVVMALILLGVWCVLALLTGHELSAVLTVLLVCGYGVVALVAWPFGLLDEWLSVGRSLLSML